MDPIQTERLLLRPFALSDLAVMETTYPEVWITDPARRGALNSTRAALEFRISEYERHGFGVMAVVLNATQELIGYCGLQIFLLKTGRLNWPEVELFYALAQPYWGQGLISEAARAVVDFGFEQLRLQRIVGGAFHANTRSINVMRRVGMDIAAWPDEPDWVLGTLQNPAAAR